MKAGCALLALSLTACSASGVKTSPIASSSATEIASSAPSTPPPPSPPPAGAIDGRPELVLQLSRGRGAWTVYAPNGKVAFTTMLGAFGVVDVDTGRVLASFPRRCVGSAAFSADNRMLFFADCTGEGDGAHVWDLETGEILDVDLHVESPRFTRGDAGTTMVAFTKEAAWTIDAWTRAVTKLDVPTDAEVLFARVADDGAVVVFGRRALFHFAPKSATATRTEYGDGKFVAAEFDGKGSKVVLLFEDGKARVVSVTSGKTIDEVPACLAETTARKPKDVWFSGGGKRVVVQCGYAVSVLRPSPSEPGGLAGDGDLTREIFNAPKQEFSIQVDGDHLFVRGRGDVSQVVDIPTGTVVSKLKIGDYEALAGGTRVGEKGGTLVLDVKTGKPIWAPKEDTLGALTELRAKAALFSRVAIDLRTGANYPALALSLDGSVSVTQEIRQDPLRGVATVTNRDTGKTWTTETDPQEYLLLSSSGDYVLESTTDWSTRTGTPILVVHGPKSARRVDNMGPVAIGQGDLVAIGYRNANGTVCRIHNVATGADAILDDDLAGGAIWAGPSRVVLTRRSFWDVSARKIAWSLDPSDDLMGVEADSDVVVVGPSKRGESPTRRVLEAKTGKVVATIEKGGDVIGQSGRLLLLDRGGSVVLWKDGVETPIALRARADRTLVRITDDAAFVWYQRKDQRLAAYRVADGRELLVGPGLSAMTDEGVFDPKDAEHLPVLVRSGPNVIGSKYTPLAELAATHGHADLWKDFFAGAAVSPRP